MSFPVTALYALPLIVIWMILFFQISARRATLNASIGDAGDVALHERIRRHGNFIEWVPMLLILMLLAESAAANSTALHAAGGFVVLGRVIHPFGLRADTAAHPMRMIGNSLNILAATILAVLIVIALFF